MVVSKSNAESIFNFLYIFASPALGRKDTYLLLLPSGSIKGGGAWGHLPPPPLEGLPPCPPSQKKKWPKSAIFGKFLDFCPSELHFAPSMPPTNFLVPPLLFPLLVLLSVTKGLPFCHILCCVCFTVFYLNLGNNCNMEQDLRSHVKSTIGLV